MVSTKFLKLTVVDASYLHGTTRREKITINPAYIEEYYSWGPPLDKSLVEEPDKIGDSSTVIKMQSGFEVCVAESEQYIEQFLHEQYMQFLTINKL